MNKYGVRWKCDCGMLVETVFYEFEPAIKYKTMHNGTVIISDVLVRYFEVISSDRFSDAILSLIRQNLEYLSDDCGFSGGREVTTW